MYILYKNSVVLNFHPLNAKSKHLPHASAPNQVLLPHRQDIRPEGEEMVFHFPVFVTYPGENSSDPFYG